MPRDLFKGRVDFFQKTVVQSGQLLTVLFKRIFEVVVRFGREDDPHHRALLLSFR
jgi:hypothetical protein